MPSFKDSLIVLLGSILLGIIGALPVGILALFFGNVDTARDIYILGITIIASWFPLKFLVDSQIKGQVNFKLPAITFNQLSIFVLLVAALPLIILLYVNTFLSFLVATLAYRFTEGGLLLALILGMGLQLISIYRGSQREKAMGTRNNIFMRVQDVNQAGFSFNIDPSQMRQQTPREDEPQVIYLPEDNLRDRSQDTSDEAPMTFNIDPDTVSEQSDDET